MLSRPFSFSVAFMLVTIMGFYLVGVQFNENETGVVFQFGKPSRSIDKPGLYFKWPLPIQTVEKFDKRIQIFEGQFEQGLTKDGKNIIVASVVYWKITDPLVFYQSTGNMPEYENKLESIIRSSQNAVIGENNLSSFINIDKSKVELDKIEKTIKEQLVTTNQKQFGVEILDYKIKRIQFPESTTAEIFERMKAERSRLIEKIKASGKGQAETILSEAETTRATTLATTNAKAKQIKAEADAEAAQYYKIFEEDKELAQFLFELDALEKALKEESTLVLDTNTSPFNLLKPKQEISNDK